MQCMKILDNQMIVWVKKLLYNKKIQTFVVGFILLLGIGCRFLVSIRGFNYDFESYLLVVDSIDQNNNVYTLTDRYNYGPLWFHLLRFLFILSSEDKLLFRYYLITFLSLIDIGIFWILFKKYGKLAGIFFFINPISIIITGYHNQFDNLAILLGIFSVIVLDSNKEKSINLRNISGLLLLGLSLVSKHVLFLFPLWLALKQKNNKFMIITILVPYFIFILSFIPYWHDGYKGIINNVFLYESWNNGYFYSLLVPDFFKLLFSSRTIWVTLLIFFAIYFKEKNNLDSLFLYTSILVIASPAVTNQYLAIVIPFLAVNFKNPISLLYSIVGFWFLLIDSNGLHFDFQNPLGQLSRDIFYPVLILLLVLVFIMSNWQENIKNQFKNFVNRVY